jgi:hypothetical protein
MPKITAYKLNLLENGLDFVRSGIEIYFSRQTPKLRSHKYAILHVFSGMLLLLKERLARIRPSLIFVCEADAGKLGAKTTNYHQTFRRLEEHGITIDPAKRAVLDIIQILRNAIEHYHVELSLTECKEVIGEMISFIHGFCIDELNIWIEDKLPEEVLRHFYELEGVTDNINEFMAKDAAAEAEAEERIFREFKHQYAAMSSDELLRHAATAVAVAIEDVPRFRCPRCDEETLLFLEIGVCANPACRATYEIDNCGYCGQPMVKRDGWPSFSPCAECLAT